MEGSEKITKAFEKKYVKLSMSDNRTVQFARFDWPTKFIKQ